MAAAGAAMLRGGAYKPRTSPFAFKGLGIEALKILAEAHAETGLPVVTEFLDTNHAEAIAEYADVIQIGARNMQNYALLEVAGKLGKPVLLKRGLSSSLDELLMAADYILKEGMDKVMLCERGIRTFETATRFTLDLSAVPWLKLHTHLPVIVDPSHASGDRRLVEPLARAAAAVGADGIIVEVHQDPEEALCDGPQALYARDFAGFAERVVRPRRAHRPPAVLTAGQVRADERGDRDGGAEQLHAVRVVAAHDRDREGDDGDEVHEQRGVGRAEPLDALVPRQHRGQRADHDDVDELPPDRGHVAGRRAS